MWATMIIALIASLIGYASMTSGVALARVADSSLATALASNMASYRAGVIDYANTNPAATCPAPVTAFPTGYVAMNPPLWTNCILNNGTIVVYASSMPEADIIDAISKMSQRSVMAGRINTVLSRIDLPFNSTDAEVTLPALPASMPAYQNGLPVWLAHRG